MVVTVNICTSWGLPCNLCYIYKKKKKKRMIMLQQYRNWQTWSITLSTPSKLHQNLTGCFTRSLTVEDFRGIDAAPSFLCNIGIVQLTETTDCRKEQVPKPCLLGFNLVTKMRFITQSASACCDSIILLMQALIMTSKAHNRNRLPLFPENRFLV